MTVPTHRVSLLSPVFYVSLSKSHVSSLMSSSTWLLAANQLSELCTGTQLSLAFGLWNIFRGVWDSCPSDLGELGLERTLSHISLLVASPQKPQSNPDLLHVCEMWCEV